MTDSLWRKRQEPEALKLALEALEFVNQTGDTQTFDMCYADKAITAIKEALAQPDATMQSLKDLKRSVCDEVGKATLVQQEQEPVGQLLEDAFGRGQVMWFNKPKDESMLYTTPPQRKPLSDEQKKNIFLKFYGKHWAYTNQIKHVMEAVEAAHGIKE